MTKIQLTILVKSLINSISAFLKDLITEENSDKIPAKNGSNSHVNWSGIEVK